MSIIDTHLRIYDFVTNLLEKYGVALDNASLVHIRTYLEAGEYEMTLESTLLSVIEFNIDLNESEKNLAAQLCLAVGLNEDSVFEGSFWRKFQIYLTNKQL